MSSSSAHPTSCFGSAPAPRGCRWPGLHEHRADAGDLHLAGPGERGRGWARPTPPRPVPPVGLERRWRPPRCRRRTGTGDSVRFPPAGGSEVGRPRGRSVATVTQRPLSGLRRSWLTALDGRPTRGPGWCHRTATAPSRSSGARARARRSGDLVELGRQQVAHEPGPQSHAGLGDLHVLTGDGLGLAVVEVALSTSSSAPMRLTATSSRAVGSSAGTKPRRRTAAGRTARDRLPVAVRPRSAG
jgi:hypothetical protein